MSTPRLWRLHVAQTTSDEEADTIGLGLLADHQILVPVATDDDLRDWLATGIGVAVD